MRIGIYARKSVYRENSDSVAVQVKSCRDYANLIFNGQDLQFTIYDQDEGFSGKNTNRPSFLALMRDIKAGCLDVVMVYKLDRISRSVKDFSETYETMYENNVSFLSVKESFDTSTPIGRTVMYILAAFAQLERENTSERVTDGMYALGASGKWTGGKVPTGMTTIRKVVGEKEHSYLIVDEERIKLVKMLYEQFLSGYSITALERYCTNNSIKSERGKFLNTSQIHIILTNPVYCSNDLDAYYYLKDKGCSMPDKQLFDGKHGLIGYAKTKQSTKRIKQDSFSIAIGIHEPIISGSDWVKVQNRFGQNKMFRAAKYEIGILKGVLKCECGSRMDIRTYIKNGITFSYYYCAKMHRNGRGYCDSGYTRVDQIDSAFVQKLKEIKLHPESILPQKTEALPVSLEKLKSELKSIDGSINNLTAALMENMESTASIYIIKNIEKLDREKKTIESTLRKYELNENNMKSELDTKEEIYNNICNLLDNFDSIPYREKNELIKKIVKTCVFNGENLSITF